jgi:ACS family tartrate transporter-like MFS transporter
VNKASEKLLPTLSADATASAQLAAVVRKVSVRLLPFLFLLYLVAYLDRINIGFAALTMRGDLALSGQMYGLATGIFFWGYVLFELPSNWALHRFGARRWIARILITWGVLAVLSGFVRTAQELYAARFLLGVAEAGFFPGIIYYLTLWFPERERARAVGLFMIAVPLASVTGGPLSGLILDHVRGLGLASWRWLLILEALPAVACGIATYRLLPDDPEKARFLSSDEKILLTNRLAAEQSLPCAPALSTRWSFLRMPRIHLVAVHLLVMMGLYTLSFWMPQSLKAVALGYSNIGIGLLVAVPSIFCIVAQLLVSRSSDRRAERHVHLAVTLAVAAVGLYSVSRANSLATCLVGWSAVAFGIGGYFGPFWACASKGLRGRAAALGLAVTNSIGNLGSYIGSAVLGAAAQSTGAVASGYQVVAGALAIAGLLALAHRLHEPVRRPPADAGWTHGRSNLPEPESYI